MATKGGTITIPYEPTGDGRAWVHGIGIRVARKLAGIKTTYHMASLCVWSQTMQVKYERLTRHLIDIESVFTMIRVCNKETK